ncbi:ester cyclase [uncultured Psychroserpens sp.]|uniref:ester cyclase n=1 Tax=uncultured Psychroserpens sp. TaxID=255436 RepID=UPI00262FB60D|nr:ester cyclase [uncultured Psychroserpens sp.]
MSTLKENRAFIVRYFNAISGKIKTPQLCGQFILDKKLIDHIMFFDGAFPKYELFIEEMIAEDNKVLVRGRAIGIHKAEFNGIPPTNRTMDLPFVIRYVIKHKKIIDYWLLADQVILMDQLGVTTTKSELPTQ